MDLHLTLTLSLDFSILRLSENITIKNVGTIIQY